MTTLLKIETAHFLPNDQFLGYRLTLPPPGRRISGEPEGVPSVFLVYADQGGMPGLRYVDRTRGFVGEGVTYTVVFDSDRGRREPPAAVVADDAALTETLAWLVLTSVLFIDQKKPRDERLALAANAVRNVLDNYRSNPK